MEKISIKQKITFWLILISLLPILWVFFDLLTTKIFFKIEKQNIYPRIFSNIFHHTLDNNVNVVEENGRYGQTRLITNSIGFRDKVSEKLVMKHQIIELYLLEVHIPKDFLETMKSHLLE